MECFVNRRGFVEVWQRKFMSEEMRTEKSEGGSTTEGERRSKKIVDN